MSATASASRIVQSCAHSPSLPSFVVSTTTLPPGTCGAAVPGPTASATRTAAIAASPSRVPRREGKVTADRLGAATVVSRATGPMDGPRRSLRPRDVALALLHDNRLALDEV